MDSIMKQVDANGDGEISFEEFTELMRNASMWVIYSFDSLI